MSQKRNWTRSHYWAVFCCIKGVRAGWQCRKCKTCQVCRIIGDESKLMTCEQCDKVYHAMCQRPVVATIPKYGWKCKVKIKLTHM